MDLSGFTGDLDRYVVVKGFIDARSSDGHELHGVFVSVSAYQKMLYFKEYFTDEPLNKEMEWNSLMSLVEGSSPPINDRVADAKNRFHSKVDGEKMLMFGRHRLDEKEIERKISRFFSDELSLNAVVFAEVIDMTEEDVRMQFPFLQDREDQPGDAQGDTPSASDAAGAGGGDEDDGEEREIDVIYLACDPVLDTLNGIALRDLKEGDLIEVGLPRDSMYSRFLESSDPTYRGKLDAEVTGVQIDELGAGVVVVRIAEGVMGTLRLAESVKLKCVAMAEERANRSMVAPIPKDAVFALVAIIAGLVVLIILVEMLL